ncbi:MAG TPA: CHRD domain-containing protein [Flavisolibacter sp.]
MKKIFTHTSKNYFLLLLTMLIMVPASATIYPFYNTYSGTQEVPPNGSPGRGAIAGTYNDVTNTISYTIIFSGLTAPTTAAHFHGPAAMGVPAGVVLAHTGCPTGVTSGVYTMSQVLTEAQEADLKNSLWYSNIHSTAIPSGEIRAQVILGDPSVSSPLKGTYSGTQEVPPNSSPGTGTIIGTFNHSTNEISYSIIFSGLTAPTTAAHFHGPAAVGVGAGVAVAHTGFPTGVMSGFYQATNTLNNTQEVHLLSGLWYSNIHTTLLPGGEIRAQIVVTDILPPVVSVPVPGITSMWPPNHKMQHVSVSYTSSDNFPAAVSCNLSVTSNEPVTSSSDMTSPDWIITGNQAVQLRAERSGEGNGRIYTITVTCTDGQGNSTSRTTTVTVAHNRNMREITGTLHNNVLTAAVYPNPSGEQFQLLVQASNTLQPVQMRLFDVTGRQVAHKNQVQPGVTVTFGQQLQAGIYLLEIRQGEIITRQQVIKTE